MKYIHQYKAHENTGPKAGMQHLKKDLKNNKKKRKTYLRCRPTPTLEQRKWNSEDGNKETFVVEQCGRKT